jgi:putative drug exporter of the RND superfamily
MAGPLYRLGHLCTRRRVVFLVGWLAIVIVVVALAKGAGLETNNNLTLPGTGSQDAADLLDNKFPTQANGTNPLAFEAPAGKKLTDADLKKVIDQVSKTYANNDAVQQAVGPFDADASGQLSKDKTVGFISLNLKDSASELSEDEANDLIDLDQPLEKAGLQPAAGGYLGQKVSTPSTSISVVIGLVAAVIILLFTFGTVVAMGMPIITAIIGVATGLSILSLLSHAVQVPTAAPALATMIGLGVGIDYALFVVTRYRRALRDGTEPHEAVARAGATSGGAVAFAGTTVIIALLSLYAAGIPLVTTLGYTSAIIVAVAVAGALTLLPTLLAFIRERINHWALPGLGAHHDDRPHGWARWAAFVGRNPIPSLIVGIAVLALLAWPIRNLELGQQDNGALPKSTQSRQSYDLMSKGFGAGSNGSILVSVSLQKPAQNDQAQLNQVKQHQQTAAQQQQAAAQQAAALGQPPPQPTAKQQQQQAQAKQQEQYLSSPASDPRLTKLRDDIEKTKGVKSVTLPLLNNKGTAAVYTVIPDAAPSAHATTDLVHTLRDDVIPAATKGQQMTAYVGGSTAGYIDLASQISDHLPLVIGIVLALSFIVLLLAFRSLLVPLKAVVMNVFSILAAFGVVTYVFDHSWSAKLIGLNGPEEIVSYVPLMMFAILFGLSMDYEVFLMTHVREHFEQSGDPHEAVVDGLARTGRVITSAALIMVSVFTAFVLNGDPTVKQFGLGMAAAVAVDATIVRCLLVPAIMRLLGKAGWYMPHWLDRATPELSIEGEEFFTALEQREAAKAPAAEPVGSGDSQ